MSRWIFLWKMGESLKVFEQKNRIRSYLSRRVEIRLPQGERLKVRRPARMWWW